MSDTSMTIWGFWITVAGTILGGVSLVLTIYVSTTASKIKKNFIKKHLQEKYRKSKKTILLQLHTSYSLLKEDNFLDKNSIYESIILLRIYENVLSKTTNKKLKNLEKLIKSHKEWNAISQNVEIRNVLYELITRLESELDEHTAYLEEVTK